MIWRCEKNSVLGSTILIIIFKLLFLLTKHVQEDAFITWRVAQNIIDYGVYGFNGLEKISSSTTHLYVLVSVIFKLLFSDNFMYILLIFNSILFTVGTKKLADLLLSSDKSKILFIIFVNLLPPALKISILGMEFGLLFLLYVLFLDLAMVKRKKWAFLLFPVLIAWTRLDAGLFLAVTFLYDLIKYRKLNYPFILAGVLSIATLAGFNYFYFGEIVNHTITAKKTAYGSPDSFFDRILEMINYTNYYSVLKIPLGILRINTFFILTTLFSIYAFYKIKNWITKSQFFILSVIYTYAWVRILTFGLANSWFDWYYWIPQIFMFIPTILFFIISPSRVKVTVYVILFFIPLLLYQTIHSIATGHGEWYYNRKVGLYIDSIEPDKSKTIYLEPAGYIPYFSKLKAIDYVGLVDKRVTEEFKKGKNNVHESNLNALKPDYVLEDSKPMFGGSVDSVISGNYKLIKEFHILDVAKSDNYLLDKIYKLKPSGRDHYLYKRIK
ncbi:MAG: hypothetical protein LBQ84_04600 [Flavobacteriaceae bacterium]|jgi:hypothetical protein|nr:hypothetical protein [Flavobacteriaceae bacterium]